VSSTHAVVRDALVALEAVAILAGGTGGGRIHMLALALTDTVREACASATAELVVSANAVVAETGDVALDFQACLVGVAGAALITRILDALLRGRVSVVAGGARLAITTRVAQRAGAILVLYIALDDTGTFNYRIGIPEAGDAVRRETNGLACVHGERAVVVVVTALGGIAVLRAVAARNARGRDVVSATAGTVQTSQALVGVVGRAVGAAGCGTLGVTAAGEVRPSRTAGRTHAVSTGSAVFWALHSVGDTVACADVLHVAGEAGEAVRGRVIVPVALAHAKVAGRVTPPTPTARKDGRSLTVVVVVVAEVHAHARLGEALSRDVEEFILTANSGTDR